MGYYINIGNAAFQSVRNGEYVDKSGLIAVVNNTLFSERRFSCVSRCRRFGKSVAAKMLCAYYDQSCDSRELFTDLMIAQDASFEKHLNKYPVIYLDMTSFTTRFHDERIVDNLELELKRDVLKAYPDETVDAAADFMQTLLAISEQTGQKFIFIIDEWDAICREFNPATPAMDRYVAWLRRMFKSVDGARAFAAVYMTGILPIKKYKTESALNNFREYSMIVSGKMSRYFGFTKEEVRRLAGKHGMDFDELEKWYDGYQIGDEHSMFNPTSVMQAIENGHCTSYWAATGAYDAVASYIQMNYEGLKDDIISMLAEGRCPVEPTGFQNDMSVIHGKDDVLTVLIHLGYLSYDWSCNECYIPNREVAGEMVNAVKTSKWSVVISAIEKSEQLLQATLRGDEEAVARGVDAAHDDNTSILSYNDENSLACVLTIAFYYARNNYVMHRELATGKGFADLVLVPRKGVDSPAILLELKYNHDADSAINQIHRKDYPAKLRDYADRLLLVGISYDRDTMQHSCRIEKSENIKV